MTTYETTARWGALKLSEEMDIQSDLGPENETEYVQNFLMEKWIRVFGRYFLNCADEVATRVVAPNISPSNLDVQASNSKDEACQS